MCERVPGGGVVLGVFSFNIRTALHKECKDVKVAAITTPVKSGSAMTGAEGIRKIEQGAEMECAVGILMYEGGC